MFKKQKTILATILIVIIVLSTIMAYSIQHSKQQKNKNTSTFVGVTYGGNSVSEAKQLINKVKTYTNLFILQSGNLQRNPDAINEIGDYAVATGLYFIPYFGNYIEASLATWLDSAKQRWNDHLLGIYYRDELGGKMLDDYYKFTDPITGNAITKTRYGDIVVEKANGEIIHYEIDGNINLYEPTNNGEGKYSTYKPDGTIILQHGATATTTYQKLSANRPLKTNEEIVQQITTQNTNDLNFLKKSTTVFSSDYVLYWYNYQSGYDVILTQLGWNISLNQQISLCRGAAVTQNKDWGVIVTWRYNNPPYLDSGDEIYNQLKTSYECGAKYMVLFNFYEEDASNPYGTLKNEHFNALKRFWRDVVENPHIKPNTIEANSVLILPKNFGGGLRWREDTVWGVFKADDTSGRIWDLTQTTLNTYGYTLDIVYDDPTYTLSPNYTNIIKFQK
ncbi:MAG: hypothetical protein LBE76_03045 [Nitrososphaerota archaeon]|jgi:hypothetical protein|nr:hypothetical protein [Nitrososphaerota archaeon]